MISEEAVDAAAKAEWMLNGRRNPATDQWEDQDGDYRDWLRGNARIILAAAAPHMCPQE